MSDRRFTDKPDLNPEAVHALAEDHPAMVENRTLFPSTVVEVTETEPDRLLVSGQNNRKLGKIVEKGKFKGYAIYSLTLEERATCPLDCEARGYCYGSSMQMARRHKIGDADVFYDRLAFEICDLATLHSGLLIRLHVLGDFPSVEYVSFWKEVLDENPTVACYGYTHRRTTAWGGDEIGDAIEAVKDAHPDRFRIRWSTEVARPDGAVIVDTVPDRPRIEEGIVCPAQTDATACCATCGLCWEPTAKNDTIVFVKHGRKSRGAADDLVVARNGSEASVRPIKALDCPKAIEANHVGSTPPSVRLVSPGALLVEAAYQRDLSRKSIRLIRKIVGDFSWTKFKPPIVAETDAGLFVIDGQHTAIAAETHPGIKQIPVLIVSADELTKRADSFVSHNRDRVAMSALQVFHAEVTAGDETATEILKIALGQGANIPRFIPPKRSSRPGDAIAITAFRRIFKHGGRETLGRVLRIAVKSGFQPINSTLAYGLEMICRSDYFAPVAKLSDDAIAKAIAAIPNLDKEAQELGSDLQQNRYRAAALLIAEEAGIELVKA